MSSERERGMNMLKRQNGVALITVLFFLIIITILAAGSIMISSTQLTVSGGLLMHEATFYAAEGGMDFVIPLVKSIYYDQVVPAAFTPFVKDDVANIIKEFTDPQEKYDVDTFYPLPDTDTFPVPDASTTPATGPDIVLTINGAQVEVDVDYMGMVSGTEGSDIMQAMYYSAGKAAKSNMYIGFEIHTRATTPKTKAELIGVYGVPIK